MQDEEEEKRVEAADILRSLVDKIVLTPVEGKVEIDVQGDLPGILMISAQTKTPAGGAAQSQVQMVAGAGSNLHLLPEHVKMVAGTRNRRPLRNGAGQQKTSSADALEVSQVSLVAGARSQRYMRLVERQIPKLAA